MTGYCNGNFLPISEIMVPVTSFSINRGYGAFEFFEVINGRPFFGKLHLERLERSMELLKLNCGRKIDEIRLAILEIIDRNQISHGYLKMFVLPHEPIDGDCFNASLYIFPTNGVQFSESLYENGAKVESRKFQRFLPEAKSIDYLAGIYWNSEIKDPNVVDVLYYDDESVRETSRGNFFMISNNELYTPSEKILNGITRQIVLNICKDKGIKVHLGAVKLSTLLEADEMFLASTTKLILPVIQVDDKIIADGHPGKITNNIMVELDEIRSHYGI